MAVDTEVRQCRESYGIDEEMLSEVNIRIAIWDALQRITNNSNKNGEDINEGGGGGRSSEGISMTDPKKIDDTIKAPMITGYSCLDGMAWRSEEVE